MAKTSSISAPVSEPSGGGTAHAARKSLALLLLASAALMVAWSFAVPVCEGPDEPSHWQYACYLNSKHALPIERPGFIEANHPPLYYLLIAPLAVDARIPPTGHVVGPHGDLLFLFPPRAYQNASGDFGLYWPFRAARLASVLLSVFTVWFCALAGAEASGNSWTGLLVGGLVGFWPMFTFRGMNVSNDALVTMFSALAVYLIVRLIRRGFTWCIGILAAVAVAGAFLSKISAMVLLAALLLAIIFEKAPWRTKLTRVGVAGAITLIIVAPWLIRNQLLYGDPLAQRALRMAEPELVGKHLLGSSYFRDYFPLTLIKSFIGNFGWMNLQLPVVAYWVYALALVSACGCWIVGIRRRRIDVRLSLILSSVIVLNLMAVIQFNLTFTQPQGRYMLPALPAIALLLGLGLGSLRSWSKFRTILTVGGLALTNLVILVSLVIPAYWPPVIIR